MQVTARSAFPVEGRSYKDALQILNSRQRQRRPNVAAREQQPNLPAPSSGTPDLKGSPGIVGMREWLQSLGHSDQDIDGLNIIHVAGTKGKGSTCAFAESFLRSHGRRTGYPQTTGLYTSPHLMQVEERIRINGKPLSSALFARYFFEVYDSLPQLRAAYDASKDVVQRGPRYLQLLALLAFHTFIKEKVDAVVLETHCGGEYDATNIIQHPVVTAVTTLGMDHVDMLGPTLQNIAWHKAGIFKSDAIALSAPQAPVAMDVLDRRSGAKGGHVQMIETDARLPSQSAILEPGVQRINASLAAATVQAWLKQTESADLTAKDVHEGLKHFIWPGRFQTITDGEYRWYLDAAHNNMSVQIAARWFCEAIQKRKQRRLSAKPLILIFSHINELRDSTALLDTLGKALQSADISLDHVIFSTYDETRQGRSPDTESKSTMFQATWTAIQPKTQTWNEPTIQGAIALAKRLCPNESWGGIAKVHPVHKYLAP